MRLGTSSPLMHNSAEEWAKNQTALGCRAVVFPLSSDDPEEKINEYVDAAKSTVFSLPKWASGEMRCRKIPRTEKHKGITA